MSASTTHSFDVTDLDFADKVLDASRHRPVVVDFWAAWCSPCRILTPVLEKVVEGYGGKVLLAKLNVDGNPVAASRYRVTSLPAVQVFLGGEVVDGFVGAQPPALVREFLERNVPSPAQAYFEEAEQALEAGDTRKAGEMLQSADPLDPKNEKLHLLKAETRFHEGDTTGARAYLAQVDAFGRHKAERARLEARLSFAEICSAPKPEAETQGTLEERFVEAHCLAAQGKYREALEALLFVLESDRHFRQGAAREAMLRIFDAIGIRTPLANEFRDRMSRLLF